MRHWPEVPIHDDITTLKGNLGVADVITGGFPCQDLSLGNAASRRGLDGERSGLWTQMARLVSEIRPRFVVVENVPGLLSLGMGRVLGDLAELGYDAEWHCLRAAFAGVPQIRDRIWIVAYPASERMEGIGQEALLRLYELPWLENERSAAAWRGRSDLPASRLCRVRNGVPNHMDRLKSLGNALVPQIAEAIFRAIGD